MGHFEPYSIGKRNLEKANHWEELDIKSFKITKPTVLCFGGNGTIVPKDANAMCKIGQGLIGLKIPTAENEFATTNDVDFVGIAYGVDSVVGNGALTDEERIELVQNIFISLCVDEQGSILSKEQMLKNFNQITFFSHCYGSEEITNLIENSFQQMVNLGIDEKTSNEVLNQMFTVSYAPIKKCDHPSLQVIPMKDDMIKIGPANSLISNRFLEGRLNIKDYNNGTVAFKEDDFTVSVLTTDMTEDLTHEHSILVTARDCDWKYKEGIPAYGDEVSQVMGNALASSIANSIQNYNTEAFIPKPTLDVILEEAQSILGETQNINFANEIEQIKKEINSPQKDETSMNETASTKLVNSATTVSSTTIEKLQNALPNQGLTQDIEVEQ